MVRETSTDFLRIDISSKQTRRIISACQNDTIHRTIHFLLSNNGIPMDLSNLFYAEIIVKRVDGTETDNPCIIEGNDIQYTLNSNDIAVVGENEGHLFLTFNDGSTFESPVFYLNVFSTFYNPAALQSQNEYQTLTQQVLNAESYANSAAASADSASEYAENAFEYASEGSEFALEAYEAASTAASETASELNSTMSSYMTSTSEYASQAHTYASEAHSYANAAASHKASTSEYMTSASEYASAAASDAAVTNSNVDSTSAYASSAAAKASETAIIKSETADYMTSTSEYMVSASEYASTAGSHASIAGSNASEAASYMDSASSYASEAGSEASYANSCAGEAEYWYNQAEAIAEGFAGTLIPMGTVAFANLPSLENVQSGWMYNISDEFTTTSDFKEGAGLVVPLGSNVYKTSDGYWDILAGSPVTGVKGDNEQIYKRGNVNLTKADIGLGNVRNEDIGDTDISGIGATVKAAIKAVWDKFADYQTKLTNPLTQSDVKDNLTSTDTNKPLSAAQGKALKATIDGLDVSDPSADGESVTFIASITQTNGLISALKKTVSTVAKGAAGLCPALPNETTTTKYLRQDGIWVAPPIATTTSKTGSGTTVTNTIASGTSLNNAVGTLLNNDNALKSALASKGDILSISGTTLSLKSGNSSLSSVTIPSGPSRETLTYTVNSTYIGAGTYLSVYRYGKVVYITGVLQNINAYNVPTGTNVVLGLPKGSWISYLWGYCTTGISMFCIKEDGTLDWRQITGTWNSNTSASITGCYICTD